MILQEGVRVLIEGESGGLQRSLAGGLNSVVNFRNGVAAALAAVAAKSTMMAAQLDKDLRLVATLGGEAKTNMEGLRQEIQGLGREFGQNFQMLAQANYQAVSGGFKSIAQSMELTRAGTKLAVAGNADLIGSTEAVVKSLNAFGMSAEDAEKASAQLWGITRDGIITVEQLSRFMADLPVAMATSGIKFEEMSAAISTITAAGVPAATAMDQIRSAIIKMEQQGITGTLVERMERFVGKGIGELTTILGEQSAARGVLVLANNLQKLKQNVVAANDVQGDFNEAVELMNDSTLSQWDRVVQNVNARMQDLGATLMELVIPGLALMNGLLEEQTEKDLGSLIDPETGRITTVADVAARGRRESDWRMFDSSSSSPLSQTWATGGNRAPVPVRIAEMDAGLMIGGQSADQVLAAEGARWRNALPPPFVPGGRRYGSAAAAQGLTPTQEFIGGELGAFDFDANAKAIVKAHSAMQGFNASAIMAGTSAQFLSTAVGSQLASAFGTAGGAVQQFIQTLVSAFTQRLAAQVMTSFLPGFSSGGYTGSTGGIVHPNEFVFNANAVQAIGVGQLQRMQATAGSGQTTNVIDITVNATSGDAQEIAHLTADEVGRATRDANTRNVSSQYKTAAELY